MLAKCTSAGCVSPRKAVIQQCEMWSEMSRTAGREAPQHCCRLTSCLQTFLPHPLTQASQTRSGGAIVHSWRAVKTHREQTQSTLTLWLNMSVSCRSCVYWHRCCRIISTLSTSSLSSSWTWRKTSPYFYWNLSLEAQRKDDRQKAASRCDTAPGSRFGAALCGCTTPLHCKE